MLVSQVSCDRRARVQRACWLGSAIVLLFASPAFAQNQSLAVLGLSSDDDEALAAELTDALRAEARSDPDYRVSSSHVSLSQMTMANDCDITEAPCRSRIARALDVKQVIYGELHRASSVSYEVELHMFASSGTASSARRSIPKGETNRTDLGRHARALLLALEGRSDAEMSADEAPPANTVSADVKPLGAEDHETAPSHSEEAPQASRGSNDWLGYTLLGVAGVSLALTVFSWTQISAASDDKDFTTYRAAVFAQKPTVPDVCDEASAKRSYGVDANTLANTRNACSTGKTFERLQYVFIGATLVAAGVGTYFLLDDDGPEHAKKDGPRLAVRPNFQRYGAGLNLRLDL
jgi:hypothetical protein